MTPALALTEAPWYTPLMASVTATLRAALRDCGESRYAVSGKTGIPESTLSRFNGGKPLRGENIDKLCAYLGLELTPKTPKTTKGR